MWFLSKLYFYIYFVRINRIKNEVKANWFSRHKDTYLLRWSPHMRFYPSPLCHSLVIYLVHLPFLHQNQELSKKYIYYDKRVSDYCLMPNEQCSAIARMSYILERMMMMSTLYETNKLLDFQSDSWLKQIAFVIFLPRFYRSRIWF